MNQRMLIAITNYKLKRQHPKLKIFIKSYDKALPQFNVFKGFGLKPRLFCYLDLNYDLN
jgi:hypothetical protein